MARAARRVRPRADVPARLRRQLPDRRAGDVLRIEAHRRRPPSRLAVSRNAARSSARNGGPAARRGGVGSGRVAARSSLPARRPLSRARGRHLRGERHARLDGASRGQLRVDRVTRGRRRGALWRQESRAGVERLDRRPTQRGAAAARPASGERPRPGRDGPAMWRGASDVVSACVAGRIAAGVPLDRRGPPTAGSVRRRSRVLPPPARRPRRWRACLRVGGRWPLDCRVAIDAGGQCTPVRRSVPHRDRIGRHQPADAIGAPLVTGPAPIRAHARGGAVREREKPAGDGRCPVRGTLAIDRILERDGVGSGALVAGWHAARRAALHARRVVRSGAALRRRAIAAGTDRRPRPRRRARVGCERSSGNQSIALHVRSHGAA